MQHYTVSRWPRVAYVRFVVVHICLYLQQVLRLKFTVNFG